MTDLIKLAEELDNNPEAGAHQDGLNMMAATALREAAAELEKLRAELAEAKVGKFTAGQSVEIFMTKERVTVKERYPTLWVLEEKEKGKHRMITEDSLRALAALKEGK